jgi:hypothetical protein
MATKNHELILDYIGSKVRDCEEVNHAWRVAQGVTKMGCSDRVVDVALLHDIVEDGYSTLENLKSLFNLNEPQVIALDAITRKEGERYFDYIRRLKANAIAKNIKLSDLQDNISRCANDLQHRWGLLRRYAKAYAILIDEWDDNSIGVV